MPPVDAAQSTNSNPPKSVLLSRDGYIQLTPFGTAPVDLAALRSNAIRLLNNSKKCRVAAKDCLETGDIERIVNQAINFRTSLQTIVAAEIQGHLGRAGFRHRLVSGAAGDKWLDVFGVIGVNGQVANEESRAAA